VPYFPHFLVDVFSAGNTNKVTLPLLMNNYTRTNAVNNWPMLSIYQLNNCKEIDF